MSTQKTVECDKNGQGVVALPDRLAAVALASGIRASLLFHQQLGIECYPLTPALRQNLAKNMKKSDTTVERLKRVSCSLTPPHKGQPPSDKAVATPRQLASVHRDIQACRLCPLVTADTGKVTGAGSVASRLLIIGDYSRQTADFSATTLFGAAEDAMLWNMMRAIGLTPEDVYVTNAVKCCPQDAQQPEKENEQRCLAHLHREIELVQPQIICAMGETAVRAILGSSEPVVRLRGKFHRYKYGGEAGDHIPIMVTFHPCALLECADLKKATWHDLQIIQRQLQTICHT